MPGAFGFGNDPYFLWATGDAHKEQTNLRPDTPHLHDPVGGGGVALNAWHAAMIASQYFSFGQQAWFRFSALLDNQQNPVEIRDGMAMNDPAVRQFTGLGDTARDVKHYISVWQFLYSPEKIAARWAGSGY